MEEMPLSCRGMCGPKVHLVEDGTYSKDSKASLHISKVQGSRPAIHEVLTPLHALAFCMQEFTSDYPCSKQRKASEWFISLVMFFWHFMMTSAFILPLHPTLPAKVM